MNDQFFLEKRYKQSITYIFKEMLKIVEDMKADHDFHYQKLYENIPQKYHSIINAANHFDKTKSAWIRKKILDSGNDCLRNFESEMENYTVSFIFKNN
jgi:hypothetical protein